jgi:anti-sigma-K factor RskA
MNPHDADNAMAADYVMGLLDGAEHAAAEQRIATDQSFAQAVSAWRGRLADLDLTAEETPPSPALSQRSCLR